MEQFKVGDVVRLKSGGPLMTVSEIEEDGKYWCVWFSDKERKGDTFTGQALKPFEKGKIAAD